MNIYVPGTGRLAAALVAGLTLASLAPAKALAQGDIPVSPPPFALLLLDTGERMNLEPGTNAPPTCVDERSLSRWMMVQEALVGSMSRYCCRAILAAPLPNVALQTLYAPCGDVSFGDDGLLESLGASVRFGLMTSDPVPDPGQTEMGGYSYGNPVLSQGLQFNLGAKNQLGVGPDGSIEYGALVGFFELGEVDPQAHNRKLAHFLTGRIEHPVVPFGKTSLAAMLDDARFFFAHHPSVLPPSEEDGEDQFASCRSKAVILVTSGRSYPDFDRLTPTPGQYADAYGGADTQAAMLLSREGVKTYVFYFPDNGDESLGDRMDRIAQAGGTGSAHVVGSGAELKQGMTQVFSELLAGVGSKTKTTSTFQTFDNQVAQIEVAAAYTVPAEGKWYGHLEFAKYRCGDDRAFELHDFGEILDGQDERYHQQGRRILTPLGGELKPLAFSPADDSNGLTPGRLGLPADQAEDLVEYVLGGGNETYPRREHALGAIVHSNPQIMGPPMLELPFPSYQGVSNDRPGFKFRYKHRPTVVYVGADDGMLHAFVVAAPPEGASLMGKELFAFVPKAIQPRLKALSNPHEPMVDGTPIIRDVRLEADFDDPSRDRWITVLLGGARGGGRFYFALNVTDPVALANDPDGQTEGVPHYMWELDGSDPEAPEVVRQRLGYTYARPAIGSVIVNQGAEPTEKAVAFFPGGKPVDGLPDSGKAFFVVDLETGDIIRTFAPGQDSTDEMDFPITGTPAAYGSLPGHPTTRVFVGDMGGRLWRIDTSSPDPDEWTMRVFYDPYERDEPANRRPVYHEPSLALRPTGELVVIYGTGDPDLRLDTRRHHKLVSLTEYLSFDAQGRPEASFGEHPNFLITFQPGEHLTGPTVVFDSTLYFATYRHDDESACRYGETRIWGVDYVGNDPDDEDDVLPRFPTNQDVDVVPPQDGGWYENDAPSCVEEPGEGGAYTKQALYCLMPSGSVVYGLEITRNPACSDYFGDWLGGNQQGGDAQQRAAPGKPTLTVQTGMFVPVGLLGLPMQGQSRALKLRRTLNQPHVSTMPLMWGIIYDD